jgi:hypothetical protein
MTYDKKAPPIGKIRKAPMKVFKCDCVNRKFAPNECGTLEVSDMGDGEFEIEGVFLNAKSVDRLLRFLLRAKVGMLTIDMKNWAKKQKK